MIYLCLIIAAVAVFYAGVRFERDRNSGAFDRSFAVDEPPQYVPTRKQMAMWSRERQRIPTVRS